MRLCTETRTCDICWGKSRSTTRRAIQYAQTICRSWASIPTCAQTASLRVEAGQQDRIYCVWIAFALLFSEAQPCPPTPSPPCNQSQCNDTSANGRNKSERKIKTHHVQQSGVKSFWFDFRPLKSTLRFLLAHTLSLVSSDFVENCFGC